MYYTTPRRRHSSLFERMENEIKKISKKLSAAKQSYKGSAVKPKHSHLTSYNSMQERNPPTVRKYPESNDATQSIKPTTVFLKRRPSNGFISRGQTINLDEGLVQKNYFSNANKIILKLQDENSKLSHRLGKMEQTCEDQSYKIGYIKAQLKQTSRQLQIQRQKQFKETCYLTTLLEYYKKKAGKYKKIVQESSEVSIEVSSEQV